MSEQLQLRRGTSTQVAAFTGAAGEAVMDTTNNRLVINDGATVGGWAAAKLSEVQTNAYVGVADAAHSVAATDRTIGYTSITATRSVSLPAASSFPVGTPLLVVDHSGSCGPTKMIVVTPAGSDDINGSANSYSIALAFGWVELESNGSNGWTIVGQFAAAQSVSGANMTFAVIEFLQSGLSGSSVTCSTQIPTNCIVFAVGARVTTAITASGGGTSFSVGDQTGQGDGSASSTRFGSGLPFTLGTSNFGLIGPSACYTPATNILLTPSAGSFTAGAVRLSIHLAFCNPSNS